MSESTQEQIIKLAIGRILRMGARPTQPGDIEEYERCRRIILDMTDSDSPCVSLRLHKG